MLDSAALASLALPAAVLSSLIVLIVLVAIVDRQERETLERNAKKKPETVPTPEASTQPADEEDEEQGGIGLHVLPRVRPPPRLARTPTHKMTREQHATFTTAIHTVIAE